jgi:hypothetical protein
MRFIKIIFASCFFLFAAFINTANAQLSVHDSLLYTHAVKNVVDVYHQNLTDQSGIFNGSQYEGYKVSFNDGHPYYKNDVLEKGNIIYDHVAYENVGMLYDLVRDLIVVQDSTHRIQLVNERINEFNLYGDRFIRIEKKESRSALIATGFYNVMYVGNIGLYKKVVKRIREKISNTNELTALFEVTNYYYIKKDNVFYTIDKKKDVLRLFKNKQKEIERYIDEEQLNFRKDKDNMLTKVVTYYDQFTK